MKKNYLKKWLAMTLALTMTFSSSGLAVLAAEEPEEAAVTQAAADSAEESGPEAAEAVQEETVEEAAPEAEEEAAPEAGAEATQEESAAEETPEAEAEAAAEEIEIAAEAANQADEEEDSEADVTESAGEAAEESDEAYAGEPDVIEEPAEAGAQNDLVLDAEEPAVIAASAIEIAGKTYAYADVSEVPEGSDVTITVDGEEHKAAEFTAIGDTGIVYYSADPLSGSLYGTDPAQVTSYTDFYSSKGVNAESADYDVITSATAFSGFHAKDISPLIARSEDGITGIYDSVEVDAAAYAEATILKAAGRTLTAEQEKVIAVTLNEDPAADPEAAGKTVAVASSSYGYSCKYGDGEFIINPDDTVEGFVWSDYKNALYAATISDGTNTTGAVWWIDLYGESATSGPHYNKVEIAVNNGTSKGSNQAEVGRYAAMYNSEKQELKAGTYTVTLYARGYNTVSTDIKVLSSFDGEVKAALSADKKSVELTGLDGMENPKATVTRTEGTGRNAKTFTYASGADVVDGKVALDTSENELVYAVYTVTLNSDNYAPVVTTFEYAFSGYVLMNIPYSVFYGAEDATVADVDAVTSATDKVGNYTMTGGAFHTGKTADETGAAAGKANGAKVAGVIWPVKVETIEEAAALGGTEVTPETQVTIAEAHHGQSSTFNMVGYEALVEQPAYSYYVLPEAPDYYLTLSGGNFSAVQGEAVRKEENEPAVTFGSNWGDVQIVVTAEDVNDKLVDAVVLTADDGKEAGLYHLDQIWRGTQLAFKADVTEGLSGKTITNIRFYCMVKDDDTQDASAPDYANYVYDYPVNIKVGAIYTGAMSAAFDSAKQITVTGLPEDAENVKAKVYTGRGANMAYLTPLVVDPADGDIDPAAADVADGKIAIEPGAATSGETTKTYGEPVDGTTYTVELSSDNYILRKITATYEKPEQQEQTISATADKEKIAVGTTAAITVTGAEGELSFASSDESIATVAADGKVKGKAPGTVTIKVTAAATDAYSEGTAEVAVRVVPGKTTRGDMFNLANNVKVTWTAVPGAKYYKVYRSGVKDPVIVTSGLVGWDKTAGLVDGKKYTYKIVASTTGKGDDSGDSTLSYSKVMYRLKTVAIKSVKNTAAGKVTVSYNKSATGDSYVLQYADNEAMNGAKTIVIQGANTTSKVIGGLKKGKTYYIQIRVRKKVGGILYYTTFGVKKKIKVTK